MGAFQVLDPTTGNKFISNIHMYLKILHLFSASALGQAIDTCKMTNFNHKLVNMLMTECDVPVPGIFHFFGGIGTGIGTN